MVFSQEPSLDTEEFHMYRHYRRVLTYSNVILETPSATLSVLRTTPFLRDVFHGVRQVGHPVFVVLVRIQTPLIFRQLAADVAPERSPQSAVDVGHVRRQAVFPREHFVTLCARKLEFSGDPRGIWNIHHIPPALTICNNEGTVTKNRDIVLDSA